jgi:hypothetical protein
MQQVAFVVAPNHSVFLHLHAAMMLAKLPSFVTL